jgi:hypothetical protein
VRSFYEQMQVVRHEAVRNYCEPMLRPSAQNLIENKADVLCIIEIRIALERAER